MTVMNLETKTYVCMYTHEDNLLGRTFLKITGLLFKSISYLARK